MTHATMMARHSPFW